MKAWVNRSSANSDASRLAGGRDRHTSSADPTVSKLLTAASPNVPGAALAAWSELLMFSDPCVRPVKWLATKGKLGHSLLPGDRSGGFQPAIKAFVDIPPPQRSLETILPPYLQIGPCMKLAWLLCLLKSASHLYVAIVARRGLRVVLCKTWLSSWLFLTDPTPTMSSCP